MFTVVSAASFLVVSEFTAICFFPTIINTALYFYLFSLYFGKGNKRIRVFVPLIAASLSLHITFFLLEMRRSYVREVNIWVLALLLAAACAVLALGSGSRSGVTAITNMCAPIFFVITPLAAINILTGSVAQGPLAGSDIYQYILTIVSPPSTALCLTYMTRDSFRVSKLFLPFFWAIALAVSFFLFDSPFFRALALNFAAPVLIAVEMLSLKEAVLRGKNAPDKNG